MLTLVLIAAATIPAFTLENAGDGPLLSSRELSGKPYVLQFFASWCTSCGGVATEMRAALQAHPGIRYVPVSLDEERAAAAKGPFGKNAYFDKGRALATALGDVGVPTVVVVGGDGQMLAKISGHFGAAQRGELESALNKGTH
jgi:thiol-disulfide isomerase/thioredoxin